MKRHAWKDRLKRYVFLSWFYVYILKSEFFDRYYIGQTDNVKNRIIYHNNGYVKSTAPYVPWVLIFFVEKANRSDAVLLERKLKNLNRHRLEEFIKKYKKDI